MEQRGKGGGGLSARTTILEGSGQEGEEWGGEEKRGKGGGGLSALTIMLEGRDRGKIMCTEQILT